MGRLTKRVEAGAAVYYLYGFGAFDEMDALAECVDRLAAYEDMMDRWKLRCIEEADTIFRRVNALGGTDLMAQYRDLGSIDHLRELVGAEKDGRLVVLPCKESTVYTIEEDYFNCTECRHRDSAYYQEQIKRVSCDMDSGFRCPFYIKEHEVTGFEIMFDKTGNVVLSGPGEFGYEGLEQFAGIDSKVYYTREEAEAALKKMDKEEDNAAD